MFNTFSTYICFFVAFLCSFSQPVKAQTDLEYYVRVLERKVELQNDSMHRLERNLSTAKVIMLKEHLKKKAWIKVAIGETVLIGGVALAIITGAWVPALMATGLIEIYLLIEGKYRLNIKKLKIIRRTDKNLSDYIK